LRNNNEDFKLKKVNKTDYRLLYELLQERELIQNISHKKIPTYKQHVKFVMSKPYSNWYIIIYQNEKIGSSYISKQNEIGIHIKNIFKKNKLEEKVLMMIMEKNPRRRFIANVNPKNKEKMLFFKKHGFKLVQYSYELIPGKNHEKN